MKWKPALDESLASERQKEVKKLQAKAALADELGTTIRVKHTSMGNGEDYLSLVNGGDFDAYSSEEIEDILYAWLAAYNALEGAE